MNQVTIVGNVTRDSEYKTMRNGMGMAKFSVACDRKVTIAGEEKQYTDYVNVVVFGGIADEAGTLKKGERVVVVGRFETRKYESNGETKYSTSVNAEVVGRALAYQKPNPGAFNRFGGEEIPF